MTWTAVILCLICQVLIIVGQMLLKRGVSGRKPRMQYFMLGIVSMGIWFFLWLGLMGKWDLSKLYPFEGLNPVLLAIAAWLWLKEKLPVSAWVGLALVGVGVAIVAAS